jgi:hypothetical protein
MGEGRGMCPYKGLLGDWQLMSRHARLVLLHPLVPKDHFQAEWLQ